MGTTYDKVCENLILAVIEECYVSLTCVRFSYAGVHQRDYTRGNHICTRMELWQSKEASAAHVHTGDNSDII